MFQFLRNFDPSPVLVAFGTVRIYWYGFFIVLGLIAGMVVFIKLSERLKIGKESAFDLVFLLIIGGLAGARLYHCLVQWSYYSARPLELIKIWHGGLAIHGAIFSGAAIIYFWARKNRLNFWKITAAILPALALGQTIGRWGNYFNQELFGRPTDLPWGIYIEPMSRPARYFFSEYFHPIFLYESLGSLIIFSLLLFLFIRATGKNKAEFNGQNFKIIVLIYVFFYSLLRFAMEFLRTDPTMEFFGLRFPQIVSLILIAAAIWLFLPELLKKRKKML